MPNYTQVHKLPKRTEFQGFPILYYDVTVVIQRHVSKGSIIY